MEWNVFFIDSGPVLFGAYAVVSMVCLVAVPILGKLRPDKVSFLPSMRYDAGTRGTSLRLWRPGSMETLDDRPTKAAERLHGEGVYEMVIGRVHACRAMHRHGRALNLLLPRAIADLDDDEVRAKGVDAFEIVDGELVAGLFLGWNFGDGHLHDERLLAALEDQCHLAPGELRCVFLESQPAGKPTRCCRIADAARGTIDEGTIDEGKVAVRDLLELQPWVADLPGAVRR
ncbi:MAG: DUF3556 domain-containing protein [Acidimicrobiales bacterium]